MKKLGKCLCIIWILLFFCTGTFLYASIVIFTTSGQSPNLQINFYENPCDYDDLEDFDYEEYFTDPEREEDIVYVIYYNEIESQEDEEWALALLLGFDYAFSYAVTGDTLGVGIFFTDGSGKIYFVERNLYNEYMDDEISDDQFIDSIRWIDVED